MSKVSIIMPVYNTEKYLGEAIDSVLSQTYTDLELLLINDRSTDRSKAIYEEYSKLDNRIVLLENNSESHGPGPTRNIGLDHATGEFVYFMDSDDWMDKRLLECAVNCIQETKADIVQFGAVYERCDPKDSEQYCWPGKHTLTKAEIKKDLISFWKEYRNSLWMHLFKRETVEKIRFENIINGEDISYVMDALCKADKIAYIAKPLYHYRYVEGSTSHCWNQYTIACREVIWKHQRKFLESFQGEINPLIYAEVAYENYIWAIYQLSTKICILSYKDKIRELSKLKKTIGFEVYRKIYPLELQQGIEKLKYVLVKYRLEWILLLFGPLFLRIVRGE